jgi:hypothetical protein
MADQNSKRNRGYILTSVGRKKLNDRIAQLETENNKKYTPSELYCLALEFANQGLSTVTIRKILSNKKAEKTSIEFLFKALGIQLDKSDYIRKGISRFGNSLTAPIDYNPGFIFYAYNQDWWVGRKNLIDDLSQKIRDSCQLLLILGLTGVGKTALAERLSEELKDWLGTNWKNKVRRANFDSDKKPTDFASNARRWLEESGESISEDDRVEQLLEKLVKYLCKNQVLVLIDALEKLLKHDEKNRWGDFADEWWGKFFEQLLSAEFCQSRLIVTSQDLPIKLKNIASHYSSRYHQQILYGLEELEQLALFEKKGLNISQDSLDRELFMRIGKILRGHPLMLRIIVKEIINKPFNGNVQAYWNDEKERTGKKIEEVEKALSEAEQGNNFGEKDEWKLHKLTLPVQQQANEMFLEVAFERLKKQALRELLCK